MSFIRHGDFSIGSECWSGTSKLIEEMGELGQVLGKLIGTGGDAEHWDGTNLRERLVEEIGDVKGAIAFFERMNMTPKECHDILNRSREKEALFNRWQEGQQ